MAYFGTMRYGKSSMKPTTDFIHLPTNPTR